MPALPQAVVIIHACAIASFMLVTSVGAQTATEPATESAPAAEAPVEQPQAKDFQLILAEGSLKVTVPGAWEKVKPRNRIIEAEIAVKPDPRNAGGDSGRLTIMAAGGSVEQNTARWAGQFKAAEPLIEEEKVDGMKLTWFDAAGLYFDSPRGPFGPKVEKPDYRMLAGILETKNQGRYFFKLVGPQTLVEKNAKGFRAMVKSVKVVVE